MMCLLENFPLLDKHNGIVTEEGWMASVVSGKIMMLTTRNPLHFDDDSSAQEYVRKRADEGSELHRQAIAFSAYKRLTR